MLKINVISKTYRVTAVTDKGIYTSTRVTAESVKAARLRAFFPSGWTITGVKEE